MNDCLYKDNFRVSENAGLHGQGHNKKEALSFRYDPEQGGMDAVYVQFAGPDYRA